MPFCPLALTAPKPPPAAYPYRLKTLGDHLRKRRLDLGLLRRELAKGLGIHEATIYNWENNRSSPTLRLLPRTLAFLGCEPYDTQTTTLGERIVAARRRLRLSQKELARCLDVDPSTVGRWERGVGQPSRKCQERLAAFFTPDLADGGGPER